jgi:hypothetical protein
MRIVEGQMTDTFKESLTQAMIRSGYIVVSVTSNEVSVKKIKKGEAVLYSVRLYYSKDYKNVAAVVIKDSRHINKFVRTRKEIGVLAGEVANAIKEDASEYSAACVA